MGRKTNFTSKTDKDIRRIGIYKSCLGIVVFWYQSIVPYGSYNNLAWI